MRLPIHDKIFGYYRITVESKDRTRLINLFLKHKIISYPQGEYIWLVAAKDKKRLSREAAALGIQLYISPLGGLPGYVLRYQSRWGIPLGIFLVCLILLFAGTHVWQVDIQGNENVSDAVIEENLRKLGFGVGSSTKRTDLALLSDAYRAAFHDVSYMSIYIEGTVAHVKVMETETKEDNKDKQSIPSHLVSACDAVIHGLDVSHGKPLVKIGQVVKAGEILVSGFVEGAHADFLLSAEGRIMGAVTEEIFIKIPLSKTKETVQKREIAQISINFFGKTRNIFTNTGKMGTSYGTIVKENALYLPSGKSLPISFVMKEAVFYQSEKVTLSFAEALRLANADLKTLLAAKVGEGELLAKSVSVEEKEGTLFLACTVRYTKNIAVPSPITVTP